MQSEALETGAAVEQGLSRFCEPLVELMEEQYIGFEFCHEMEL